MAIESGFIRRGRVTAPLLLASIICAPSVHAADVVWETRFDPVFAPAFESPIPLDEAMGGAQPSSQLALAPDGDLYYYARDEMQYPTVTRLAGADLTPIWARSMHTYWAKGFNALDGRAAAGGPLAVLGGVVRYAPDGTWLWARGSAGRVGHPADVALLDDGSVLTVVSAQTSNEPALARIDPHSGALRDRVPLPASLAPCTIGLLAVGPADAIYVAAGCADEAAERTQVFRLSADGSVVWTTVWPEGFSLDRSVYGSEVADASGLYLVRSRPDATEERVKLSAADGSMAWTRVGNAGFAALDAAGRLLTLQASGSGHRVEALDATTGAVLWSQSRAAQEMTMALAGAAVYLAGTDPTRSAGVAERLDLASGATVWQTPLPAMMAARLFRPRDLLATQSRVFVAGSDCLPWIECRGRLFGLDSESGLVTAAVQPAIPQSAIVDAMADGPDHQLVSSLEQREQGPHVRVKRIDAAGQVKWEHLWPIDTPLPISAAEVRRAGDGDLLLAANSPTSYESILPGYPYLAKYGEDGTLRWARELRLWSDQVTAGFSAGSDADGNVFVGLCAIVEDGSWIGNSVRRRILRLNGATGEIDWSLSFDGGPVEGSLQQGVLRPSGTADDIDRPLSPQGGLWGSCLDIPRFDVIDRDLLLWEAPAPVVLADAPMRIAGADHAVIWSNAALASSQTELLARDGDDGYLGLAGGRIVALSLATGQPLWNYQDGDAERRVGFRYARIADDGDLYVSGWVRWPSHNTRIVTRLDAEDGSLRWVYETEQDRSASLPSARVHDVAADHVLFLDVFTTTPGYTHVRVSRLDRASGTPIDASVNAQGWVDEALPADLLSVRAVASDGGLLVAGSSSGPEEPIRPWVAKVVAPDRARHGNLATSLAVEPALASVGESVQVRMQVSYVGDAPAEGVIVWVRSPDSPVAGLFPDALVWSDPVCTSANGVCTVETTPAGLRARLDLPADGEAQIVATARLVAAMPGLSAEAYAPYGLFEPDLGDNYDAAWIGPDALFADGFD
ncbi:MAG TPA: PQQ-binding-like beta-propeller repeat protein [Dokdonella sp.]|uniref:outer membrane protein assembly factor BamB family protein n=1 Tax=Dokdonella sp. TaxID=2291710 RepID=UPI002D0349F5|nr:PQQ-binding-like beta-propeller repeat protein [Dokdonella sp.]HUD43035.1 PQQ-binding-like beta-propeller repeat protein [Dokdonella sp.]